MVLIIPITPCMSLVDVSADEVNYPGGSATTSALLTMESPFFSVTVPTSITATITSNGNVVTASNIRVVNNSSLPIYITNISFSASSDWKCVDYATDMSKQSVNKKVVGISINGCKTTDNGTFEYTNQFPAISHELSMQYLVKVPKQTSSSLQKMGDIVMTFNWNY